MKRVEDDTILENDMKVRRLSSPERVVTEGVTDSRVPGPGRLALLVCFSTLLGGCSPSSSSRHFETAQEAAAAEDWPQAADLWYRIHLSEQVKTALPYLETARALYNSGDHESACQMLRDGLAHFPEDQALLAYYASRLEELGFQRAAEMYYARLVEVDPDSYVGWLGLGRVRMGIGHELAAEEPLERALLLNPESAEAHTYLARSSQVSGDRPRAYDHYLEAIRLGANDPSLLLDAGSITIEEEVLRARPDASERGLSWISMVLEIDPQSTCAHYLRAVHLEKRGDKTGALVSYMRAAETDPSCVPALSRLAELYAEAGDLMRAGEMVNRALAVEQDPARRQALLGLLESGDS
jgi:protein O-GlcNAc transferase